MALDLTPWHEYPTNFSNGTSMEGVSGMIQYASTVTGGAFPWFVLVLTFSISFITAKTFSSEKAGLAALFGTTMVSFIFSLMGVFSFFIPITIGVFMAVAVLAVRAENKRGL